MVAEDGLAGGGVGRQDEDGAVQAAGAPERKEAVTAAFAAVVGKELRPTYVTLEAGEETPPPDLPAPGSGELDEEAILAKVKSEFGAEEVG